MVAQGEKNTPLHSDPKQRELKTEWMGTDDGGALRQKHITTLHYDRSASFHNQLSQCKTREQLEKKINENRENNYSERIKNSFNSKNNFKSWNNNWETIRLLIIFSFLIIGFAFIYTQIDSVLEILTNSQSK